MKRSTAKILSVINYVLMLIVITVAAILFENKAIIYGIGTVFLVIALILGHFLRCPSCGRHHKNWLLTEYCPYCGEPLDD